MFEKPIGPSARHFKHGLSHTRIDNIYRSMLQRCYSPSQNRYPIYGGRGIRVCDEWLNDKKTFFSWAFEHGYSNNLTLDRINSDGNYEPSNCRWATQKEQQNNRRNNKQIEINGESHTIAEWADIINVKYATLHAHLKKNNITEYILARL